MGMRRFCLALAMWAAICPFLRVRGDAPVGSIRIAMVQDGIPIPGGELTLYPVAAESEAGFVVTEEFASSGVSLEDVHSPEAAWLLAEFAENQGIPGMTCPVDYAGIACFHRLGKGIYLIAQTQCAEGFYPINPFLVAIPQISDGAYQYHIEAAPKLRPEPPEPTEQPQEPELPQTGQLSWPVPVLGGVGVICAGTGFWLCFGRKRKEDEK